MMSMLGLLVVSNEVFTSEGMAINISSCKMEGEMQEEEGVWRIICEMKSKHEDG